jgi:hypothetical protein
MSSFSSTFIPAIGSSRRRRSGQGSPELNALLQAVRQLANRNLSDRFDLEKVDDLFHRDPVFDLLFKGWPEP